MPDISIIAVPSYQPLQPYFYQVDNLPINALVQRDEIINSAVDTNTSILESAIGTAGTLAARLDQSLEPNGNLKTTKINEALHNIGSHADGSYDGLDYVRMLLSEREKLALISDEATNVTIQVDQISQVAFFNSGSVVFKNYITGLNVPYEIGSLRVYINGVRIYSDGSLIYVPTPLATSSYKLNGYTENDSRTGFVLDNAITANDIIRIDFDLPLD